MPVAMLRPRTAAIWGTEMERPDFILSDTGPPAPPYVPGSTLVPCSGCGVSRWVSPQCFAYLELGIPVYCAACAPDLSGPAILGEEQRQEIERALGRPYSWDEYRHTSAALSKQLRRPGAGRDAGFVARREP